jgi:hypothetical protein
MHPCHNRRDNASVRSAQRVDDAKLWQTVFPFMSFPLWSSSPLNSWFPVDFPTFRRVRSSQLCGQTKQKTGAHPCPERDSISQFQHFLSNLDGETIGKKIFDFVMKYFYVTVKRCFVKLFSRLRSHSTHTKWTCNCNFNIMSFMSWRWQPSGRNMSNMSPCCPLLLYNK